MTLALASCVCSASCGSGRSAVAADQPARPTQRPHRTAPSRRPRPRRRQAQRRSPAPTPAPSGGLEVADCTNPADPEIRIVDTTTGTVLRSVSIAPPPGLPTTIETLQNGCGQGITGYSDSSQITGLDPTLHYAGARQEESDGSVHAGVVDLASGTFTDTAAALHGTGFSASATTDAALGFTPTGTFLFTSGTNITTYQAAPPYTTATALTGPIDIASPDGSRSYTVATSTTYLHLPAGQTNTVGDNRYDAHYAPLLVGQGSTAVHTDCAQPQWLGNNALLCYYAGGVNSVATELVIDLTHAAVVPNPDQQHCPATSPCGEALEWSISAPADLLPANKHQNVNFVPSPDGTKIAFISGQGDNDVLELISPPGPSGPSTPQPLTITGTPAGSNLRLVGWTS